MSDLAVILSEQINQQYKINLSFEGRFNQEFLSASYYNPYHHIFKGIDISLGKIDGGIKKDFYFVWKRKELDFYCKNIATVFSDSSEDYQIELIDASILHLKKMSSFVNTIFLPKELEQYVNQGHLDLLESNGDYDYLGENLELLSIIHILKNKKKRSEAWNSLLFPDLI